MERVLLVDDDEDMCFAITEVLRDAGNEVIVVHDGLAALELLKQDTNFLVVLCDISMPGMDGLTLLTELKKQYPALPVIMSSALAEWLWISTALEQGAVSCLPRPFHVHELIAAVRNITPPTTA
jgi:CheY-like chemotaxis protein